MRLLLLSLASEPVLSEAEGAFPVFYQSDRPTMNRASGRSARWTGSPKGELREQRINALEKKWIDTTREKVGHASDLQLLQKTFDRMK